MPSFDVAIIGGGLTGSAVALRLLQKNPTLRLIVLDRGTGSARRPGEALPELTAHFLGRRLGLGDHLNECHYTRQGTRFWFANGDPQQPFDDCSEIGPKYLARLPTYLVDRAVLEAEMLRRAAVLGAEIRRPATVEQVVFAGNEQTLIVAGQDPVTARWVVDASGAAAVIARQKGLLRPGPEIRSVWGRWRGVADWDSPALRQKYPKWAAAFFGMRNPALNCLMGDGWWSGWTPLRGGDVSIRLTGQFEGEEIQRFLEERHPVARELLKGAKLVEGSFALQDDTSQCVERAGDGWVLAGGAAGFVDPLYGRHLDRMTGDVCAATELILNGKEIQRRVDAEDRDKYQYLGEFDLMRVAAFFDLGLYTLQAARSTYESRTESYGGQSAITRSLSHRCARIARGRRERGDLGTSNSGRRALFTSFNFNPASGVPLIGAAWRWLWLELTEGWRAR